MQRVKLTIHKEVFEFSAGHFTIFSATHREMLHGHNYQLSISFEVNVDQYGLAFDYRIYKQKIAALCKNLDTHFLLPAHNPYLRLEKQNDYWHAHFNNKILYFLLEDAIILPLTNITLEELAHWFMREIREQINPEHKELIHALEVSIYNGPGQSSTATWQA